MRRLLFASTLILSMLIALPALANSVGSSTMEFEGTLTDNGDGSYSGVIPMVVDGGYDIYAEEGGTAWFGNDPGTGPDWTSQAIGSDHDAWPTWTPDTPDWYQYSLELYVDGSIDKWAVRNHAGATETNPWYDEEFWGVGGKPACGVPMSGLMDYSSLYAAETDVGVYLPGMGIPEISGGAAGYGGGPAAWDMDWSWGSEVVPLEHSGFDVDIQEVSRGTYHVTLTPAAPDEVWVDDDFTSATPGWGATHFDSVQDGVDAVAAGGDVHVAAGTYTEQVHITADMTIDGAGVGSTVIASPATLTYYFMTGTNYNYPVVYADGADVALSDMTVDGDNQGDANYRFVGVGYWNGGGSMTDMEVLNVMNSTFSGAQHGVGIYSWNDTGGPYTLALTNVLVDDYQKTGIALFGEGMTVDLDGVTTIGQGATDVTAQNGIQVGYGAGGTLDDIVITGNYWTGATWTASGFLPSDGPSVTVDGMVLDDNQTSIYLIDMDGSFNDVTVTNPDGDALYAYSTGTTRSPMPRLEAAPFDSELGGRGGRYDMTASFTNSTFTGADVTDSWGPAAWVEGTCDFTVTGCDVSHWDYGIVAYESGGTVTSHVNGNLIYLNGSYGMYTNATPSRATQDATGNWWGDATGPYHPTLNASGLGNPVSDGIDFGSYLTSNIVCTPDPEYLTATVPTKTIDVDYQGGGGGGMYGYSVKFSWDGSIVSTAPGLVSEGTLLSDIDNTFFFARTTGTNEITVDCALLGDVDGATGPGTMFSIDFTGLAVGTSDINITVDRVRDKDNNTLTGFAEDDGLLIVDVADPVVADVMITNSTLAHTNDYIKNGDTAVVTATVTDDDPAFALGNIVADLTGLGGGAAVNPATYAGNVATWTITGVTCTPPDGVVTVTVTATDPIGNTDSGSDTIIADNTAPTAVTGFDAAPGHEECSLSWTNGSDTYLDGVVVQRDAVASEYPQYPWFVANWATGVDAAYPGSELAGTNVYNGTGASHTDGVVDRNIYYYQAFCYDIARNYGPAATTARDLATNYWLGDIVDDWGSGFTWVYDGEVDDDDILALSDAYGTVNPVTDPGDAECDVGPTVHPSYHRLGLPLCDDQVEFEDLMIFAMNYGVVAPRIVPFLPEVYDGSPLAIMLEPGETNTTISLRLEGNAGEVKGVSAEISYDPSELEFVSARLTDEMVSPIGQVFFWHGASQGHVSIDLAVLGTGVTIGGSGELATFEFRPLSDEFSVDIESARLRDVDNTELQVKLGSYASNGETPMFFRLVQNAPNPFNPKTTVAYNVPRESDVSIRVYDVAGRCVRTLVDRDVEPGRHAVVWDGTNESGEAVGSGIYFCTMEAPDFHQTMKMTLLK